MDITLDDAAYYTKPFLLNRQEWLWALGAGPRAERHGMHAELDLGNGRRRIAEGTIDTTQSHPAVNQSVHPKHAGVRSAGSHISRTETLWVSMLAALTLGTPALAHHSDSVYFIDDRDSDGGAVRIEGTVTGVRLINPHSEMFGEVVNDAGDTVRWAIESDSWNELRTLGWTQETIREGDHAAVVVSMSRFHDTAGRLRDLMIYAATPARPARLFLEHIRDASDEYGRSNAPERVLEFAPQCPDTTQYDPNRERGEETLLCFILDAATLEAARAELSGTLRILGE